MLTLTLCLNDTKKQSLKKSRFNTYERVLIKKPTIGSIGTNKTIGQNPTPNCGITHPPLSL